MNVDRKKRFNEFLYNSDIDINERLSRYFIYIGIIAAIFGTGICIFAHASLLGILATAFIALGAPSLLAVTILTKHPELFGQCIAIGLALLMPLVWIGAGGSGGGVNIWFVYELFFVALFASKKELPIYLTLCAVLEAGCFFLEYIKPEMVFHFSTTHEIYISVIGSIIVVSTTIIATVLIQKKLYIYEKESGDQKEDFSLNFVMSIASIIDARDGYTGGHSKRVASCAIEIAKKMGLSDEDVYNMGYVGLLHDIGKIGIPDAVLNKPGKLTNEEYDLIKTHTTIGYEILEGLYFIPHVQEVALYHHERYDGKGYPKVLKGEEIPLFARIIGVADAYDAMSTNRIYRKHMEYEQIVEEFKKGKGTQFDPEIADVFLNMLENGFTNTKELNLYDHQEEMESLIQNNLKDVNKEVSIENQIPELSKILEYVEAIAHKMDEKPLLVYIGYEYNPDSKSNRDTNEMDFLKRAILSTIREMDSCIPYGENEYLLVLTNVNESNVDMIMNRIQERFDELNTKSLKIVYKIAKND